MDGSARRARAAGRQAGRGLVLVTGLLCCGLACFAATEAPDRNEAPELTDAAERAMDKGLRRLANLLNAGEMKQGQNPVANHAMTLILSLSMNFYLILKRSRECALNHKNGTLCLQATLSLIHL